MPRMLDFENAGEASWRGRAADRFRCDALTASVLADLRRHLPESTALSMTALASWCMQDNWIDDLTVDEAVPMLFRMGVDATEVTTYVAEGGRFASAVCSSSVGLAVDEPVVIS